MKPHEVNYLWEHMDRNKKGIALNIGTDAGQSILQRLIAGADVFLNNLRPYELEKFNLTYDALSRGNPSLIFANLTGYGRKGPEKNAGGYDSVAFWARSGVMDKGWLVLNLSWRGALPVHITPFCGVPSVSSASRSPPPEGCSRQRRRASAYMSRTA
ncbi:MAG: CoA transferase [Thermodesulfobacteriota bacterium]